MMFSFDSAALARNISPSGLSPPTLRGAGPCWGGGRRSGDSQRLRLLSLKAPLLFVCQIQKSADSADGKGLETPSSSDLPPVATQGTALQVGGLLLLLLLRGCVGPTLPPAGYIRALACCHF